VNQPKESIIGLHTDRGYDLCRALIGLFAERDAEVHSVTDPLQNPPQQSEP
jgi:hypothetical protein